MGNMGIKVKTTRYLIRMTTRTFKAKVARDLNKFSSRLQEYPRLRIQDIVISIQEDYRDNQGYT